MGRGPKHSGGASTNIFRLVYQAMGEGTELHMVGGASHVPSQKTNGGGNDARD